MKKRLNILKSHIKDNRADTSMEKVILIAVAFVIGGLIVGAVIYGLDAYYSAGTSSKIDDILD